MTSSNYDKFPVLAVRGCDDACVTGWDMIAETLREAATRSARSKTVIVVECYTGVFEDEILLELQRRLDCAYTVSAASALLPQEKVNELVAPFIGGDDPVFGFLSGLGLRDFFESERLRKIRQDIDRISHGLVLAVGCGARLIHEGDILIYADLARWEAQKRFRREQVGNLGTANHGLAASLQYKRAYFVDWRVCDRFKDSLISEWDFVMDTNDSQEPKLARGEAVREALRQAVTRPFRVVPFFDPAPWGGQWMKEKFNLCHSAPNYGWCFDCVPEENSLWLGFGKTRLEIPSINLVLYQPGALLGEAVQARFGKEFPLRFDFLDTMGGGNLSFQVHPLNEYIQRHFGMPYTQDESYYILDAYDDASVYLGLRENVNRDSMMRDLAAAQAGGAPFDVQRYACQWPARKHDHFLIPAGTVHCSGADSMVLEISATPYIFTFKLWDWERLGLNGRPRPIHLEHGFANIMWDRTEAWVQQNLVSPITRMAAGDGWREERTGMHETQFIETRRHWFSKPVPHDTQGGVNVLNLVEGAEAIVESPTDSFEPFIVHYAETFIIPANVGRYSIRPWGQSVNRRCATIKAFVK